MIRMGCWGIVWYSCLYQALHPTKNVEDQGFYCRTVGYFNRDRFYECFIGFKLIDRVVFMGLF